MLKHFKNGIFFLFVAMTFINVYYMFNNINVHFSFYVLYLLVIITHVVFRYITKFEVSVTVTRK